MSEALEHGDFAVSEFEVDFGQGPLLGERSAHRTEHRDPPHPYESFGDCSRALERRSRRPELLKKMRPTRCGTGPSVQSLVCGRHARMVEVGRGHLSRMASLRWFEGATGESKMDGYKDLEDFLKEDCQGKFEDKTRFLGLLGSKIYTPTGEKVIGGFRYFACDVEPVIEAFNRGDLAAMLELPFALDEDGESDTSSVLISLEYTDSGSMLAMQVQEYQNYQPVAVTPSVLLEGVEAKALIAHAKELDQSL